VTETYFRDEGEAWDAFKLADGTPIVQIREKTWMDSLTDKDDMPEGDAISGATDAGDLDRLMDAYEMLRAMGMANMTYEDWLRGQGVVLARWHQQHESVDARLFPDHQPIEQRLAEYFGYDLKKIDAEQRQMLEEIRNGADATSTATLVE